MHPPEPPSSEADDLDVERILPAVYDELHALARRSFQDAPGHVTLQPTALIHEAYLKMAGRERAWRSRTHFFAIAATAMRQVLQNYFRDRNAQKRGGGARRRVTLTSNEPVHESRSVDYLDLQDALARLEEVDAALARLVELRFFAGLTVEEIAAHRGVSRSKVEKDWRLARALLRVELGSGASGSDAS